jgi:hypothetical protein
LKVAQRELKLLYVQLRCLPPDETTRPVGQRYSVSKKKRAPPPDLDTFQPPLTVAMIFARVFLQPEN